MALSPWQGDSWGLHRGWGFICSTGSERGIWAETWAVHVNPEPSPLQKKFLLSSQDLHFFHPNKVSARKKKKSGCSQGNGDASQLGGAGIPSGIPLEQHSGTMTPGGTPGGARRGRTRPGGSPEGPPGLTEMLHCHLVTRGPRGGTVGACSLAVGTLDMPQPPGASLHRLLPSSGQ